ncbi:MAG: 23S rRNA (uridine(2552)-2'-O)-methyltransferase [Candidatus Methanomethylicota archaeon]|jgi:23S rRNA (uridine2552-2'-O)-methyltransferase|uniref:Ribosomal RNA large subunit methyltransferase E n=1 Tax=Thermoproteota archaeon TaxID=2056631 RepID=A0A523BH50_9CREN|nr:MAG: 23S rRNA (uridine(2552)-2'-O)-methyltransferase [Candidatus Verstraetearchaeota archaeon]
MPAKRQVLGDFYYREAKKRGFRSRSALKLLELARRFQIFREGDCVLDLGAAPGGWLQVARDFVGPAGRVIGVDLSEIEPLPFDNVYLVKGDVFDPSVNRKIMEIAGGPVDVVLSDLAPKFSGIHDLDHARQVELARAALKLAGTMIRPGGRMVLKLIMGSEFDKFLGEVRRMFQSVRLYKPKASRESSSEIYLVCKGLRCLSNQKP